MTDPRSTMRDALLSVENFRGHAVMSRIYDRQRDKFEAIVDAACTAYGKLQTGEADGLPAYEPFTCGTHHLGAQLTLHLLMRGTPFDALPSNDAIENVRALVDDAGVAFARAELLKIQRGQSGLTDDQIPF